MGVGSLLADKPQGTDWKKVGGFSEQNNAVGIGSDRNQFTRGFAGDFNGSFDEVGHPAAPSVPAGRATGGSGVILPPRPVPMSTVGYSPSNLGSDESLRLHPNTVAFLRKHPEFAKAFIEREGFTHLRRLNTVLSYGWSVNLDDWFWGRDRYYTRTSELEIWIDTDMSMEDQTNALVALVDDIYAKKKIPLDTQDVLTAFGSPGFLDPNKPRTQALIQAQYSAAEFGRGVMADIALEAGGLPFVVLSKGDDVYKILSKLDEVAPNSVLARGTKAREVLAGNLGKHSFPVDAQAHHLFGVELFDTQLGKKLQGWGIDLNGAANGVYLPKYDYAGRVASLHRGRTAAAYTDEVVKLLGRARSGDDAIAILNKIRDDLLNGRRKINGAE
jgi:hypothetical protein